MLPHINSSTSSAFFRWKPAAWLRVLGPDAANFLQGQFTNDLRLLDRQPAVYGLWLSVKGKVLADSFILRAATPDAFWVGSYASPVAVIRERLEAYVIADDVTIEDHTLEWAGVSLYGEAAERILARSDRPGLLFPGRRARSAQMDWVYPVSAGDAAAAALGGVADLPPESMARIRITERIPAVPSDIGPADLPNEGGLEVDAISYTKGCYLGQEVMARLKSMGHVRRRLLRVRGDGDVPPLPAPVYAAERQVGELRSAVAVSGNEFVGLAMLSRLNVTAETQLALSAGGLSRLTLIDAP